MQIAQKIHTYKCTFRASKVVAPTYCIQFSKKYKVIYMD